MKKSFVPRRHETVIAGKKTADDWKALLPELNAGNNHDAWTVAFDDFYLVRLRLRYLNPINLLKHHGTFQGEGFSIVAIQCSLVEFLETTIQGKSYRHRRRNDPPLGPYEYSSSEEVFISFLTKREPFLQDFNTASAKEFYKHVRCALLHEARTKDGWTIWARNTNGRLIDANDKVVFRDNMQTAFENFLQVYRNDLLNDSNLQAAFIRKFDSLCVG